MKVLDDISCLIEKKKTALVCRNWSIDKLTEETRSVKAKRDGILFDESGSLIDRTSEQFGEVKKQDRLLGARSTALHDTISRKLCNEF